MENAYSLDRRDAAWLVVLMLLAALLRLPALDRVPPGFQFDEAYNALDALEVLRGNHRLFLPANGGREVLYTYLQAPLVALLGPTAMAGRLASALVGIITVGVLYLFVRSIWPQRRLAILASTLLACSYWHLHFSRYGIRSIATPLWFLLTFHALWRGLVSGKPGWYALVGVWMAANVWTHPAGRLAPLIMLAFAALTWRAQRDHHREPLVAIAIAGAVAMMLFAPLAWHYYQHPLTFYGHASDVAILEWGDWQGSARRLAENGWRILAMSNLRGDTEWIHNLPGRPVFDAVTGIAFLLGAALTVQRAVRAPHSERAPYTLLLVWLVTLALISLVTDMAPNFSRMMGALPVLVIMAALGLDSLYRLVLRRTGQTWAIATVAACAIIGGTLTGWDYFVRFGSEAPASYEYDQEKIEAVDYLAAASADHTVFLAELWAQHATIQLLSREMDIRSLDTAAGVVLPAEEKHGALYAYPPEQKARAEELARRWSAYGELGTVYDRHEQVLLHTFAISARQLQALRQAELDALEAPAMEAAPYADLTAGVRLRGWAVAPQADAQGKLATTLLWECVDPVPSELTAFVHLVAPDGDRYAQVDQQPLQGSYATDEWHAGDLVLDRVAVPLPMVMPADEYALQVGLYELQTTDEGVAAELLSTAEIGAIDWSGVVPVSAETLASHAVEPVDDALIQGVIAPEQLELLAPEPVSLIVSSDAAVDGAHWQVALEATAPGGRQVLGSIRLPETTAWDSAAALVLTAEMTATDAAPGHYELVIVTPGDGEAIALGNVEVIASQRLWELPALDVAIDMQFGTWARLTGVVSAALHDNALQGMAGGELPLTLVWQAGGEVNRSLAVFCHLVAQDGQIVVQHDGPPQNGAMPTSDWLSGQVVLDEFALAIPQDVPAGMYQLRVGLYDPITGQRENVLQDGATLPDGVAVLPVMVRIVDGAAP